MSASSFATTLRSSSNAMALAPPKLGYNQCPIGRRPCVGPPPSWEHATGPNGARRGHEGRSGLYRGHPPGSRAGRAVGRAVEPAIEALTQTVTSHPDDIRAYILLGRAYLANREPAKATQVYRKLVERGPKDPRGPYRHGARVRGTADAARVACGSGQKAGRGARQARGCPPGESAEPASVHAVRRHLRTKGRRLKGKGGLREGLGPQPTLRPRRQQPRLPARREPGGQRTIPAVGPDGEGSGAERATRHSLRIRKSSATSGWPR